MKNKIQLITYIDRLGVKTIDGLHKLLDNELKGLFGGVHILPFYYPIDGEDCGFDPIDHTQIDSRLGNWSNLNSLSKDMDVMADLIVNHISAESVQFQDYLKKGGESQYADLFLSFDKVFPSGATEQELLNIYRPRPGFPFAKYTVKGLGNKLMWTTFTSNQIDIDVHSKSGIEYLEGILNVFEENGVTMIRLDAAGYAIKKAGSSCFMIKETFEFIDELTKNAKKRNIEVLVEVHSYYKTQIEISKKVDYVYDFALPVLVLDSIFNRRTSNLIKWLNVSPKNVITVLDTHDGIGIVDVGSENGQAGLIDEEDLDTIVDQIHANSKGDSKKATGESASNLDLYQVNCTYFDALGRDENAYLIARAIQFFVPGIPQVYYVGLFAGFNDMQLLKTTNVGRDINRHCFTKDEIDTCVQSNMFKKLRELMLFRNNHLAFNGDFDIKGSTDSCLVLKWVNQDHWAQLKVELKHMEIEASFSDENGKSRTLFES